MTCSEEEGESFFWENMYKTQGKRKAQTKEQGGRRGTVRVHDLQRARTDEQDVQMGGGGIVQS